MQMHVIGGVINVKGNHSEALFNKYRKLPPQIYKCLYGKNN